MTLRPNPSSGDRSARPTARTARGETAALSAEEFAKRFGEAFGTLWTIAAGIVNDRSIAEDIVQEAALTALGKLDDFDPATNFTAWMAKIVRFLALNQSRRGRKQPTSVDPVSMDDTLPSLNGDRSDMRPPIDELGRLNAQNNPFDDQVLHALQSINEIARACLLLRTIQGLNYDEISRVLDIPAGTAMSHVHRTRLLLRQQLAARNPEPTSNRGTT